MQIGEHVRRARNVRVIGGESAEIGAFTVLGLPLFEPHEPLLVRAHGRVRIGSFCFLNFGTTIVSARSIRIGDRVLIGPGCHIWDTSMHHALIRSARPVSREIVLEDDVWLGARTVVLPGVHVGEGTVVRAGSIVTRSLPARCVAAGNPARVMRPLEADARIGIERTLVNLLAMAAPPECEADAEVDALAFHRIRGAGCEYLAVRDFNAFAARMAARGRCSPAALGERLGREVVRQFSRGRLNYLNIDHLELQWKDVEVSPGTFLGLFAPHLLRDLAPGAAFRTHWEPERLDVEFGPRGGGDPPDAELVAGLFEGMFAEIAGCAAAHARRGPGALVVAPLHASETAGDVPTRGETCWSS